MSWLRTEQDEDGSTIIFVTDDHVSNFTKFMDSVIQQKIGLDRGYFKIRLDRSFNSSKNMSSILDFLKLYFSSKDAQTGRLHRPDSQTFYSSSNHEDLYGYRTNILKIYSQSALKKSVSNFIKAVSTPNTFINQRNCCLDALNSGAKELSAHYWNFVRQHSIKCLNSPPSLMEHATVPDDNILLYGSSIPLIKSSFPISNNFNLSQLDTVLNIIPETIPGLSFPYLYTGTSHATFPFHIEDAALFSINYIHFGAPCVWFMVPPVDYKKFVDIAHHFKLDIGQVSCHNVLGHKYIMASEEFLRGLGITVNTVVQKPSDIIVTYPFTPHSGFKCGWNVQQAANFGHSWWVELGILAPTCICFDYQVNLKLTDIIAATKPHLLNLYVSNDVTELMKVLSKNDFVQKMGLLPVQRDKEITTASSASMKQKSKLDTRSAKSATKCNGARCTLECPDDSCSSTWAGGRGRLDRVILHIQKKHKGSPKLLEDLDAKYPAKEKDIQCPICSNWLSGNDFHLKRHMRTVHS